ncbi:MAG: periplasmic heavy metal sensor [Proteobacteria bacterium]|nr:periplasmic heavy metal sensor [Pseudomonadota bacterium]
MSKGRIIGVALVFSVSLNLLVVGAIIGRTMFGSHPRSFTPPPLGWVLRDLDADTRRKIRPGLEDRAKVVAPLRNEMHAARIEFSKLLGEKEFDEAALVKSLGRLRKASGEFQSTLHEHMVLILKDLAPEQRRKVARFLMRHHPQSREGKGHRHRTPG